VNNKKNIPIIFENKKRACRNVSRKYRAKNLAFSLRPKVFENCNKKIKNIFYFFSFSKKEKILSFHFCLFSRRAKVLGAFFFVPAYIVQFLIF